MDMTEIVRDTCPVTCIPVTDCKSLYDTVTKEKISMTDRRLSLEAAILRQSPKENSIKWVKSEQMLADCFTKVLPGGYARKIITPNLWTLGPGDRAPSIRGRKLVGPEKVAANKE
eukprot:2071762-Pyramimonas_sp.AAC.1